MTLPAVEVTIADAPGAGAAAPSIANLFAAGYTERGPADEPILITGMAGYRSTFGERVAYSSLYDALSVFFREGGGNAWIARILGPNPVKATGNVNDAVPAVAARIDAKSAGDWANDLDVVIDATGATFTLTVQLDGETVEASPSLATNADAVEWAAGSRYIDYVDLGGGDPTDQTVALAGGSDDRTNVTGTEIETALDLFDLGLGGGQVAMPGHTDATSHEAILLHADAYRRNGLLDAPDTSTVGTVEAAAIALRSIAGARFSGMFWPWDTAPGDTAGSTRTVPPSGRNAALFARAVNESNGAVGTPPAGGRFTARFVGGLSQLGLGDGDRELLNDAGVNVSIVRNGRVVTYGNRTLTSAVNDPNWAQLNQSRVIASLASEAQFIGGDYVHAKIDGQGFLLGEFAGRLQAVCGTYFARGDLYGDDVEDAATVTPAAEFESGSATIVATIDARVSPGAERVEILIYKNPIV